MTGHDTEYEGLRSLFDDVTIDRVPHSRDLVGPAVAWGARRRRGRRQAAASSVVGAAAVTGVLALALGIVVPGGPTTDSDRHPRDLTQIVDQEQALVKSLQLYLPPDFRITCAEWSCQQDFALTGPLGISSIVEWGTGTGFVRNRNTDPAFEHDHHATAENPHVTGTLSLPGGKVTIQSKDVEAQGLFDRSTLADPTAIVYNVTQYAYTPKGASSSYYISLSELTGAVPWKPGANGDEALHDSYGFNRNGPVLSPQQFADLVSPPTFASVLGQLTHLHQEADDLLLAPAAQRTVAH